MDKIILKQRVQTPQTPQTPHSGVISFRHPGYGDFSDILFKLPRLDSSPQAQVAGVHHGTALLACQIIANNAFDGYLATDREGRNRVSTVALDGILLEETYWFIVDGHDGVYPVVPRFEDWKFPHDYFQNLGWGPQPEVAGADEAENPMPTTTAPTTVTTSTMMPPPPPPSASYPRCILSNNPYALHKAHVVPWAQKDWYRVNSMKHYSDDQDFIVNDHNTVRIRHDLHTLWDAHIFALVPKRSEFVVHVLNISQPGIDEFAAKWHNTPVQEGALGSTGKAYLFAKFAQAVFMLFKNFIAFSPVSRYIAAIQARADDPRHPYEAKEQWVSGASLEMMYGGGGGKRSRSQVSSLVDEDERFWPNEAEDEETKRSEENVRGWLLAMDPEDDMERGRPGKRRQRPDQSEHALNSLSSMIDTSAIV